MNTYFLYKFYFKDSFQGLFKHPLLKKKYIRYLIGLSLLIFYFFYFYMNVNQVNVLKNVAMSTSVNELMIAKRQTLSSLYSITFLLAGFIFLLLDSGVHLNMKSIYFTKALPFRKKDILNSERLFFLSLSLILFELFVIILIPALVLITNEIFTSMLIVISIHVVFLGVFQTLRFIRSCLHKKWFIRVYQLLLLGSMYYYFVDYKYKIESFIADKPISLLTITISAMSAGVVLFILSWIMQKNLNLYMTSEYTHISCIQPSLFLLALLRTRFFKVTSFLIASMACYCYFVIKDIEIINFLFPILALIFLYYGNTTMSVRKMFPHYRISSLYEFISLLLIICIVEMPSLVLGLTTHHGLMVFLYGINLSLSALILGILLPKSISNMNELITSTVMILLIIIYLFGNIYVLCTIFIILMMVTYLTIKEATR